MPPLIYIAGPYRANTPGEVLANIDRAADLAVKLLRLGYNVICPHTMTVPFEHYGLGDDVYLRNGLAQLERCDAVCLIGLGPVIATHHVGASEADRTLFRAAVERWRDHPDQVLSLPQGYRVEVMGADFRESKGTLAELRHAHERCIPVYYRPEDIATGTALDLDALLHLDPLRESRPSGPDAAHSAPPTTQGAG